MNIAKLDEAIAYIEAHPEEHDQGAWFARRPGCGTTMCLAGVLAMLDGWRPDWRTAPDGWTSASHVRRGFRRHYIPDVAAGLLGIDPESEERAYLFLGADTLDDIKRFREEYVAGKWAYPEDE